MLGNRRAAGQPDGKDLCFSVAVLAATIWKVDQLAVARLLKYLPILLCLVLFSATLGCQDGGEVDREVDDGLGELELTQLAPGLLELFGRQPDQGALLLYEAQEHASWVVFDGNVTCLFDVKRNVSSKSSRPVTELGRDDLNAGIGCDRSDQFRNEGTSSTSTDGRHIIVSFVLPRVYWNQPWSIDDTESLEPFETIVTPESIHLVGTRRDGSRWTGGVKKFLELDISCDCGDMTMEALIIPW